MFLLIYSIVKQAQSHECKSVSTKVEQYFECTYRFTIQGVGKESAIVDSGIGQ